MICNAPTFSKDNAYLLTLFALLMYCASEYWIEPYHKAVALDNGDKA